MAWILEVSTRERAGRNVLRVEIHLGKLTVGPNVVYPICYGMYGYRYNAQLGFEASRLHTHVRGRYLCTNEQPVLSVLLLLFYSTQHNLAIQLTRG